MRVRAALAIGLSLLTAILYAPVRQHDFVTYDDPAYISANPHILSGWTAANAQWALTADVQASWGPLTQWTLMIQATAFGDRPRGYHVVDACAHLLNVVLLFLLLDGLTRRPISSAVVAALFAVHPMHVESVAWASEWKDVLSTMLVLAAMLAYVAYCRSVGRSHRARRWVSYGLLLAFAALSLLAKPMYVTLPALLLLLDLWPLRRTQPAWKLVWEKVPLAALAAAACAAALLSQAHGGAVASGASLPVSARLGHAAISYWLYLFKLLVPANLAVFYPYPAREPLLAVLAAMAGLLAVSLAACLLAKKKPYLAVGWFWFLGTLVPVIGLVQIGAQSIADRYTYFPSVGLVIAAVWWAAELIGPSRPGRIVAGCLAVSLIGSLALAARQQLNYWQNTRTLFTHAAAVTRDNWVADLELGNLALQSNDSQLAAGYYLEVMRLRPNDPRGYIGLASMLLPRNPAAAQTLYATAVQLQPGSAPLRLSYASALDSAGHPGAALVQVRAALQLDPSSAMARSAEADLLGQLSRAPPPR